nr:hypothetical protein CFP56_21851 [Quercus suber]
MPPRNLCRNRSKLYGCAFAPVKRQRTRGMLCSSANRLPLLYDRALLDFKPEATSGTIAASRHASGPQESSSAAASSKRRMFVLQTPRTLNGQPLGMHWPESLDGSLIEPVTFLNQDRTRWGGDVRMAG